MTIHPTKGWGVCFKQFLKDNPAATFETCAYHYNTYTSVVQLSIQKADDNFTCECGKYKTAISAVCSDCAAKVFNTQGAKSGRVSGGSKCHRHYDLTTTSGKIVKMICNVSLPCKWHNSNPCIEYAPPTYHPCRFCKTAVPDDVNSQCCDKCRFICQVCKSACASGFEEQCSSCYCKLGTSCKLGVSCRDEKCKTHIKYCRCIDCKIVISTAAFSNKCLGCLRKSHYQNNFDNANYKRCKTCNKLMYQWPNENCLGCQKEACKVNFLKICRDCQGGTAWLCPKCQLLKKLDHACKVGEFCIECVKIESTKALDKFIVGGDFAAFELAIINAYYKKHKCLKANCKIVKKYEGYCKKHKGCSCDDARCKGIGILFKNHLPPYNILYCTCDLGKEQEVLAKAIESEKSSQRTSSLFYMAWVTFFLAAGITFLATNDFSFSMFNKILNQCITSGGR